MLALCALGVCQRSATAQTAQTALAGALRAARDTTAAIAPGVSSDARWVGSSRAVIDSADIADAAATTLSELIATRAPSVSILQSGGLLGNAAQLRMRGPTSVLPQALPLLIVNGIPVDAEQDDSIATDARLDDIPLHDVARVELLRGPAAAALYGAGAAAGVIVVTTRQGGAHPLRWRLTSDAGAARAAEGYGTVYQGLGTRTADGTATTECGLLAIQLALCTQTGIRRSNVVRETGVLRTGTSIGSSLSASGGTAATRARLSVARRDAAGVARDDDASRATARLDLTQRIVSSLQATARVGFVRGRTRPSRVPRIVAGALTTAGAASSPDSLRRVADSTLALPARVGHLDHLTTGLQLEWRPLAAVTVRALVARDRVDQRGNVTLPVAVSQRTYDTLTTSRGIRTTRAELEARHTLLGASATLLAAVEHEHRTLGARSAHYLSVPGIYSILTLRDAENTNAVFANERLGWGDRGGFGVGARYERDALVGDAWRAYPTVDGALRVVNGWRGATVRLRGAYGEAPQREVARCSPALAPLQPGGSPVAQTCDDSPERSRESEVGVDAAFGRVAASVTGFVTTVAGVWLPDFPATASTGLAEFHRGRIRNQGVELELDASVLERGDVQWRVGVSGATLRGRLRAWSFAPTRFGPSGGGLAEGEPVWGAMPPGYTFTDRNGDGLIGFGEITGVQPSIVGSSTPNLEAAVHSSLAVGHGLVFAAVVDTRRGFYANDQLTAIACIRQHCQAMVDTSTSLASQAEAVAAAGNLLLDDDASFWRLREVTARWTLPASLAARVGAGGGAVTVGGRNLALWTRFRGSDPEINDNPRIAVARAVATGVPLPREVMVRVELEFGSR